MTPHPLDDYRLKFEHFPRRIRVEFAGQTLANSDSVLLVHERGRPPVYYFPAQDVQEALLAPSVQRTECPLKGAAQYWDIKVGERLSSDAVWRYTQPHTAAGEVLKGYYSFYWDRVDAWFEEGEQVYGHARDPYKYVDALPGARHVRVEIHGQVVAESRRPIVLYEAGVCPRFYLALDDVDMRVLVPSTTRTRCPYKGQASYWSLDVNGVLLQDVAWSYTQPLSRVSALAQLVAFDHGRIDGFTVDGQRPPDWVAQRSALEFFGAGDFYR